MNWDRAIVAGRSDIIGRRILDNGNVELLMHNEGLCAPYYTATEQQSVLGSYIRLPNPYRDDICLHGCLLNRGCVSCQGEGEHD